MRTTQALLRLTAIEELLEELTKPEVLRHKLTDEQEAAIYRAWVAVKEAKEALEKTLGPWPNVRI